MKIDDAIDKLNAAYKRLEEPQGRIARRNARRAFMAALRDLRKGLDDEYPLQRKPVRRRRKARPPIQRIKGLSRFLTAEHHALLAAGVSPSYFTTVRRPPRGQEVIYAPPWMRRARDAGFDWSIIATAVKSRKTRRRINSIVRLGGRAPARQKKKKP